MSIWSVTPVRFQLHPLTVYGVHSTPCCFCLRHSGLGVVCQVYISPFSYTQCRVYGHRLHSFSFTPSHPLCRNSKRYSMACSSWACQMVRSLADTNTCRSLLCWCTWHSCRETSDYSAHCIHLHRRRSSWPYPDDTHQSNHRYNLPGPSHSDHFHSH